MIRNTKTAEWALHIAVLQAALGEIYALQVAAMTAEQKKVLDGRIGAKAKAAIDETAAFLSKLPNNPKANCFAREIATLADVAIAEAIAEMQPPEMPAPAAPLAPAPPPTHE
jgi:hypothetical protein